MSESVVSIRRIVVLDERIGDVSAFVERMRRDRRTEFWIAHPPHGSRHLGRLLRHCRIQAGRSERNWYLVHGANGAASPRHAEREGCDAFREGELIATEIRLDE